MEIVVDCIRGYQSKNYFYSTILTYKELTSLFTFIEDKSEIPPEQRAQREINKRSVKALVKYLYSDNGYILPSIVAELEGSEFKFEPFTDKNQNNLAGRLIISINELIEVLDGQHRLASIRQILEESSDFENEGINVVIYQYVNLKLSQQRFSDLNSKGQKVSTNLSRVYDERCPIADLTRSSIKNIEQLYRKTEMEFTSPKGDKLFCFIYFYQANKIISDYLSKLKIPNLKIKSLINIYWKCVNEVMKDWQDVYNGRQTNAEVKTFSISTHSITINALGIVGRGILFDTNNSFGTQKYTKEEATIYIQKRLVGLSEIDFSKSNFPIENICLKRGKVVNNREVKDMLAKYLIDELNEKYLSTLEQK